MGRADSTDPEGPEDRSWIRRAAAVKDADRHMSGRAPARGWKRHFEGWELAVVAVSTVLLAALLFVPRPAEPDAFPLPEVDRVAQSRAAEADHARARAALRHPLPYDVRAVGEAFRGYGLASIERDTALVVDQRRDLERVAALARQRFGDAPLLTLRAVQTLFFQRALSHWEATGEQNADLRELGGEFLSHAEESGWIRAPHELVLSESERTTLFHMRWDELTGLRDTLPLSPTLDDWRAYYRLLIEHPEGSLGQGGDERRDRVRLRLGYVDALSKHDPDYPADLARGVLLYQLGMYPDSAQALRAHLLRHSDGPWTLRAQNYLRAATARAKAVTAF